MPFPYADLHCDTAFELHRTDQALLSNALAVSLERANAFSHYLQCFAVWSDSSRADDECFSDFLSVTATLDRRLAECAERITRVRSAAELADAQRVGRHAALLAVEDARLLDGHLDRLTILREHGVFYLTLLWGGDTCIGGSHDTPHGLTPFGKQVVMRCFALGIVPDISHASKESADDILSLAEQAQRPVMASHSNAYSVYPHSRNLRDEHFLRLCALDGIVGINLCAHHLGNTEQQKINVSAALRHIEHFLALGGERCLAVGADWDGAPMPQGITGIDDISCLAECMARHGYTNELIHRVLYQNAYDFTKRNLGQM